MTRIYVDEREIPPPPVAFEYLEEVIRHVESNFLQPDAVIRNVYIDGQPLMGEGVEIGANARIAGRGKVEIFTGTLKQIASDSLREAIAYVGRIEAAIPSIAQRFQIEPGPEAFKQLKQLLEGFYWLNMLVTKLSSAYGMDLQSTRILGILASEFYEKFTQILNQLVDAQERQDNLLIADLLEYEIQPLLPTWNQLFMEMERCSNSKT
jgi:hypothetical protein